MAASGMPGPAGIESAQSTFPHPLSSKARILLTSVFGPYAQDDEYGSRRINPMELYHNQVTRVQGSILAADVPSLVGSHAYPGECGRSLHPA
jgi:hypothetical protein